MSGSLLVRERLSVSVKRVESESSPGCRYYSSVLGTPDYKGSLTDPLVVRLVNVLVDPWVVFQTMNPIDEEIVEKHIQRHAKHHERPSILIHTVIQQALASNLGNEPRKCQDSNCRCGDH
jgi:hypothetical protein